MDLSAVGDTELTWALENAIQEIRKCGFSDSQIPLDNVILWQIPGLDVTKFDLVILCQSRTFFVHCDVVLKLSPIFTKNVHQLNSNLFFVDMGLVGADEMSLILAYAYKKKDSVFDDLPFPKLFKAMMTARILQMTTTEAAIRRSMWRLDETEFLMALWDMSTDVHSSEESADNLITYVLENIGTLMRKRFFARLSWQHLCAILNKARKDENASMKHLFRACLQWLNVDYHRRLSCFGEIKRFINLNDLSPRSLIYLHDADSAVEPRPKIPPNVRQCIHQPQSSTSDTQELTPRQAGSRLIPACLIFGLTGTRGTVLKLNIIGVEGWITIVEMQLNASVNYAVTMIDKRIFMIGGNDAKSVCTNKCSFYNFCTRLIQPFPDLIEGRLGASLAIHGQDLYAIGGLDKTFGNLTYLDSVERISPDSENPKWRKVPPLNDKRAFAGVVATKKYIYVIGGFTTSCERYDIAENVWSEVLTLPDRFSSSPMLAVRYRNQILAMRRKENSEMCSIGLKSNTLRIWSVSGQVPSEIITCAVIHDELWAATNDGRLYKFNVGRHWWQATDILYSGCQVRQGVFINYNDLEGLCNPRVDPIAGKARQKSKKPTNLALCEYRIRSEVQTK